MSGPSSNAASTAQQVLLDATRRELFRCGAMGLGTAALASLAPTTSPLGAAEPSAPPQPPARRAIYLFMAGAPSQLDLWDEKPETRRYVNQELPESLRRDPLRSTMTSQQSRLAIAPSIYRFAAHGPTGTRVSELIPHMGSQVDQLALIHSMHTDAINHDPAMTTLCTGSPIPGKASLGAWLSYGLGSDNENLPTFVVMTASWSGQLDAQAIYSRLWGSGFLPGQHQGVLLRSHGDPVIYLQNPKLVSRQSRRHMLDALAALNQRTWQRTGDPQVLARIAQSELAFRMQSSVPELTNLRDEPQHVLDLYGPDVKRPGSFAHCCLMARRMAERGVRLTQIFHRGWDQHLALPRDLPKQCRDVDQPSAGLLIDLRQRGLLDDTLVIWGGEFGRTVYCQGELTATSYGRDHHARCFTVWLAGGGVRSGTVFGQTDPFGVQIEQDPVHVRDLNATLLHQLGIDHRRLTYPYQGLQQRLTGAEPAEVVRGILA